MPILVPTLHHPLKMPMKPTHHVLPTPPMHIPENMTNDSTASYAPHESQSSVNTDQQTSNRNCAMSIEMTTMSRHPECGTEDRSKLQTHAVLDVPFWKRMPNNNVAQMTQIFSTLSCMKQIPAEPNLTNKNRNLININTQYAFA